MKKYRRLTPKEVNRIRVLAEQGVYQCDIAERFGCSQTSISSILAGKTWNKQMKEKKE